MASVETTVRQVILAYPSLMETRADVLHHILCVLGSGYEWVDGEPVTTASMKPWNREDALGVQEAWLQRLTIPAEALDGVRESIVADLDRCQKVVDEIDERVLTHDFAGVVYPRSNGSLLSEIPADVKPDWAAAAEWAKSLYVVRG